MTTLEEYYQEIDEFIDAQDWSVGQKERRRIKYKDRQEQMFTNSPILLAMVEIDKDPISFMDMRTERIQGQRYYIMQTIIRLRARIKALEDAQ